MSALAALEDGCDEQLVGGVSRHGCYLHFTVRGWVGCVVVPGASCPPRPRSSSSAGAGARGPPAGGLEPAFVVGGLGLCELGPVELDALDEPRALEREQALVDGLLASRRRSRAAGPSARGASARRSRVGSRPARKAARSKGRSRSTGAIAQRLGHGSPELSGGRGHEGVLGEAGSVANRRAVAAKRAGRTSSSRRSAASAGSRARSTARGSRAPAGRARPRG